MDVLVTGGAGFIGSNLCERLLGEPGVSRVRVIDDFSNGLKENLSGLDVDLVEASILDVAALDEAIDGCGAVVHLAALGSVPRSIKDPMASHHANATGTLAVLEAARDHGGLHVVLSSSSSVYGANPAIPKREDLQCRPMSPYAVSKLAAEGYALAFAEVYGLPVLPFRFFNVFGPRQRAGHVYAAVVPVFVDAALRGLPLPLHGDGTQSRDFTFVGTVTEILTSAVTGRVTGSSTNLAFGNRVTLTSMIRLIEAELGTTLEVDAHPARVGDVRHSQADNARLRSLFPDATAVSLEEGVRQTVRWMRTQIN